MRASHQQQNHEPYGGITLTFATYSALLACLCSARRLHRRITACSGWYLCIRVPTARTALSPKTRSAGHDETETGIGGSRTAIDTATAAAVVPSASNLYVQAHASPPRSGEGCSRCCCVWYFRGSTCGRLIPWPAEWESVCGSGHIWTHAQEAAATSCCYEYYNENCQ